jgi:hypothetical protein
MNITKKQFMAYEKVRKSGVTNMFDISVVQMHNHLPRKTIIYIMGNYMKFYDKWIDKTGVKLK